MRRDNYASDVGMYLRVTATYEDGQCGDPCDPKKTTQAISVNSVEAADYSNEPPVFNDANGVKIPDNQGVERSVAENSPAGTAVGEPVAATDRAEFGLDVLTYNLDTTGNNLLFDIDAGTGQIRVGRDTKLDYDVSTDAERQFTVKVTARDSSGETDEIDVTIKVTNVDEPPTITPPTDVAGLTEIKYPEIIGTSPVGQVGRTANVYAATDPEDNRAGNTPQNLRWSLLGRDANKFYITNGNGADRGKLFFREAPDYEDPRDANRDRVYNVTVEVTDRGGNRSTRDVAVEITNVEERGLITVSSLNPRRGVKITATVTDADKPITSINWEWEVGSDNLVSDSDNFTPQTSHTNTLTLALTYTDGTGESKSDETDSTLTAPTFGQIGNKASTNRSPNFSKSTDEISVAENSAGGVSIGDPFRAPDPDTADNDSLTYSLSGIDAAFFSINPANGADHGERRYEVGPREEEQLQGDRGGGRPQRRQGYCQRDHSGDGRG